LKYKVILFNFVSQSTFLQLQKLNSMKISRTKFVILFLVSAFAFQFISNSLLGSEVRLFPVNGEWFPGTGSPIAWKSTVSTILYPIKIVLIGPLSPLFKEPDPAPPILVLAFASYWTAMALVLYYLLSKIITRKKT
jgi:hypothetical protein